MRKFFLSFIAVLSTVDLLSAQTQTQHPPTFEDIQRIMASHEIVPKDSKNALKPTIQSQRLIATSIYHDDATGSMALIDTVFNTFSDVRGSRGSAQTGLISMLSDFDTSLVYTNSLSNPYVRDSRAYDQNNNLISYANYAENGTPLLKGWNEYYANNTLSKKGSYNTPNQTDYGFFETTYTANGSIETDTFSQNAGTSLNWNYKREVQFDNQGRSTFSHHVINMAFGGNLEHADVSTWYFYDNGQSIVSRDSVVTVTINPSQFPSGTKTNYYTYDGQGNLTQRITYSEPNHMPLTKIANTYNANGKLLIRLTQNYSNGQWVDLMKDENEYTNGVLTKNIASQVIPPATTFQEIYTYTYSLNADLLVDSMLIVDNDSHKQLSTYTYNDFKNLVDINRFTYASAGIPASHMITHNYYSIYEDGTPSGVGNAGKKELTANVFPNPVSDQIQVLISGFKKPAMITVLNLNGISLSERRMTSSKIMLDFSSYASGIYFIKIASEEGTCIKKIVKN